MDKILITQFKDEIAAAILNSQKQLNPNGDAYIEKNELQGVLDFFGVDDVSKLLKNSGQQSVFQNNNETEESTNTDSLEISNFSEDEKDALNESGTAARELSSKINADLSLGSVDTPLYKQMESLEKSKISNNRDNSDNTNVDIQIDALKNMVKDYLTEHPEEDSSNTIVKKFTYGKDGSKKAILSQTFSLNSNSSFGKPVKNSESSETGDTKKSDNSQTADTSGESDKSYSTDDTGSENQTDVEISYNMELRTLNTKEQGNWHIKGSVDASSNNCDIHATALYIKEFNDGSIMNFSGNIRQTIEDQNNVGNIGASVDYKKSKFLTGLYGLYNSKELDGNTTKSLVTEAYGKYGKTLRAAVGINSDDKMNYYYTQERLNGKLELPASGLTFTGGVAAEFGVIKPKDTSPNMTNTELKFREMTTFESNDFNAALGVNVATKTLKGNNEDGETKANAFLLSVLGKIDTKNFDIETAISTIKTKYKNFTESITNESKPTFTASIAIGIKNFFGKNIMPVIRYHFGNYEGAKQNIGVSVVIMQ